MRMKNAILSLMILFGAGSYAQIVSSFPYTEDFEGEIQGTTSCGGTYNMLTAGWQNDATDDIDWTSDVNGTGSLGTGPQDNSDYNPGTTSGHYLYTEASGCSFSEARLESVWFNFSAIAGGIEMSFAYHMLGGDMGTLSVEYRTGMADAWTVLTAPFTDDFDGWQISYNDITFLAGNDSVQFRYIGITGGGYESDMCLDDINIYQTVFEGSIIDVMNETCFEAANGSMTATYNYGIAPVSYSWSNGDTTATTTGLAPGTYCVTMVDAAGDSVIVCDSIVAMADAPLNVYVHAIDEWICTDSTGYLVIDSITGGSPTAILSGISSIGCTGSTDTVQVDTPVITVGGTQYPSPLGNWYWGARHQLMYRADELLAAGVLPGNLSGMAFYIDNMGTATSSLTAFTIKLAGTSDSVTTAWNDTDPVEVMAPADVLLTTGWNWFNFTEDFYWNGVDNLLVETCFNNASFTNNPYMGCQAQSYTASIWYRADSPTVCGTSSITGTSVNRPIAQFQNCEAIPEYPYIYSWDIGSSSDTTAVAAGTYTLTVTDGTGCEVIESVTINESAPVVISDMTICETNPTDFTASSTFESYLWSTSESGQTISITTGGYYFVDAVDSLGCPSSDTAFISTLPVPVISATSNDVMYGSDGYIDLLVYGAAFPFIIDWDNDGVGDADDTEDQFGLDAGDYTVIVTDTNGCYSTLTVTVNSQLSVGENQTSVYNIYPNPTKGLVHIQAVTAGTNVYADLLDMTGRTVGQMQIVGTDIATFDLSNFERGMYFIRLNVDGVPTTTKIILE